MARPPGADRTLVRASILSYLDSHAGEATQPAIRAYLVAELHVSERYARHITAEIIQGPGFVLDYQLAYRGPRVVHVRLAPPRRRREN